MIIIIMFTHHDSVSAMIASMPRLPRHAVGTRYCAASNCSCRLDKNSTVTCACNQQRMCPSSGCCRIVCWGCRSNSTLAEKQAEAPYPCMQGCSCMLKVRPGLGASATITPSSTNTACTNMHYTTESIPLSQNLLNSLHCRCWYIHTLHSTKTPQTHNHT
jgi:hypothetical protein